MIGSKAGIAWAGIAPYRIALKRPWASASTTLAYREGCILRVDTSGGRHGYGECAPLPENDGETLALARARLSEWSASVLGKGVQDAMLSLDTLRGVPAARCAAETALLDILAQAAGVPLARWLNPDAASQVAVNTALGSTGGDLRNRVAMALEQGFRVLKLKLGVNALEEEIRTLHCVAATLPGAVVLRLDANRAWPVARARQALDALAPLPVDSLEEPLRDPDASTLADLQDRVPWPLALDESLPTLLGEPLMQPLPVRRLVLKPMLLGGLLPAIGIAREAAKSGVRCVVTTTLDSAVGTLAALHLAAAVEPHLAHGLDTSRWLDGDTGSAPCVRRATMKLPERAGLGFRPGPTSPFS